MRIQTILFVAVLLLVGCAKDQTMVMNEPHNIRGVVSYKKAFNDLNDTQLAAAKKLGVSPLRARAEGEYRLGRGLEKIQPCDAYDIDQLTHSIPFLVPTAKKLLQRIGENFQDSLAAKGLNPYQVIVTSVLRTEEDVKKLRRVNTNASAQSAHCYGTTFDLTYKRYRQLPHPSGRPAQPVREDTLTLVLSEVLRDLRLQQQCYVKYERQQACFHITCR